MTSIESFKKLMTDWDQSSMASAAKKNQIQLMVENQNFILFFEQKGEIFGTNESNRVNFAKMKNPDDDTSESWLQEASIMAMNLSRALIGHPAQHIFKVKDLEGLNVISKEKAIQVLLQTSKGIEKNATIQQQQQA